MFNSPRKLRQSVPPDPRNSEEPQPTEGDSKNADEQGRMQPKHWTLRATPTTTTIAPARFPTRGPSKKRTTTTECTHLSVDTTIAQSTGESEQLSSDETTPTQHFDKTQYLSLTLDDSPTCDTIVLADQERSSSGTPPGSYRMIRSIQQGTHGKRKTGSSPVLKSTHKGPRIEVPSSVSRNPAGPQSGMAPRRTRGSPSPPIPKEQKRLETMGTLVNVVQTSKLLKKQELQNLLDDGTGRRMGKEKGKERNLGYDGMGTLRGNKGTVGTERVVLEQQMYRTDSAEKALSNEKYWKGIKGITPWTYKMLFFGLLCLPTVNAYEEYTAKTAFFWTGLMLVLLINIIQGNRLIALLTLAKIPKTQAYDWTIVNQLMAESATLTQELPDWAQVAALTITLLATAYIALRSMATLLNTGHALEAGHVRTIRAKINEIDDQYDAAMRELGTLQKYTKDLEADLEENPSVEKLREWRKIPEEAIPM
ncbi:hypothetical protein BDD12DRAFT_810422 [Trichophaea hybrida]|nr:hypothetical protein BDD12DRAFT_810422 [Trichophaea hybrida]